MWRSASCNSVRAANTNMPEFHRYSLASKNLAAVSASGFSTNRSTLRTAVEAPAPAGFM